MPKKKVLTEAVSNQTASEPKSRTKPSFPVSHFLCCKCPKVVFSSEEADRHFIEDHPTHERSNENDDNAMEHHCKFCLKFFNTLEELEKHRSIDTEDSNSASFVYTCPLCHKSGLTLTNYKVHGELEHGSDATYCCNLCPISYKNYNSFTSHVYVKHKNEQNNVCAECGKSYARKSYLESHYRVEHQGRRDFECLLCHAMFKRSCNLKSHMRVHTGELLLLSAFCDSSIKFVCFQVKNRTNVPTARKLIRITLI